VINMIKNVGLNNMFLWKNKDSYFEVDSQLTVLEYQEAIFCREGRGLDVLTEGEHVLNEDSLPILSDDLISENIKIVKGEKIPCEIFFINKGCVASLMWGSGVPIMLSFRSDDSEYYLRINGEINLRVNNSKVIVESVIRKYGQFDQFNQEVFNSYIRGVILEKIREHLSGIIMGMSVTPDEVVNNINDINPIIRKILSAQMKKFGVEIVGFSINKFVLMKKNNSVENVKKNDDMIFCGNCGAQMPARFKFCMECGGSIEKDKNTANDDYKRKHTPFIKPNYAAQNPAMPWGAYDGQHKQTVNEQVNVGMQNPTSYDYKMPLQPVNQAQIQLRQSLDKNKGTQQTSYQQSLTETFTMQQQHEQPMPQQGLYNVQVDDIPFELQLNIIEEAQMEVVSSVDSTVMLETTTSPDSMSTMSNMPNVDIMPSVDNVPPVDNKSVENITSPAGGHIANQIKCCNKCGTKIPSGSKFCFRCGESVNNAPSQNNTDATSENVNQGIQPTLVSQPTYANDSQAFVQQSLNQAPGLSGQLKNQVQKLPEQPVNIIPTVDQNQGMEVISSVETIASAEDMATMKVVETQIPDEPVKIVRQVKCCVECGKNNSTSAKFCVICGSNLN